MPHVRHAAGALSAQLSARQRRHDSLVVSRWQSPVRHVSPRQAQKEGLAAALRPDMHALCAVRRIASTAGRRRGTSADVVRQVNIKTIRPSHVALKATVERLSTKNEFAERAAWTLWGLVCVHMEALRIDQAKSWC